SYSVSFWFSFLFNDTATTQIYTLSLHDLFRSSGSLRGCGQGVRGDRRREGRRQAHRGDEPDDRARGQELDRGAHRRGDGHLGGEDRKSTRLNSSHVAISYAVFCLKKKSNCRID